MKTLPPLPGREQGGYRRVVDRVNLDSSPTPIAPTAVEPRWPPVVRVLRDRLAGPGRVCWDPYGRTACSAAKIVNRGPDMERRRMMRRDVEWALGAWREAERALAESDPGSPEWRIARAEVIRSKDRFQALTASAPDSDAGRRAAPRGARM